MNYTHVLLYQSGCREITPFENNSILNNHIYSIVNSNLREQSFLAYSLLAEMLLTYCGVFMSELQMEFGKFGKPYFPGSNISFSVSHTEGAVLCSISDSEIGSDIEFADKVYTKITEKCFTPREAKFSDSPKNFYTVWTLKEAYLKYTGTGIRQPMREIEFSLNKEHKCTVSGSKSNVLFETFYIGGYVISVCANEKVSPIHVITDPGLTHPDN